VILPDNQKLRKNCHSLTLSIFQEIIKSCVPQQQKSLVFEEEYPSEPISAAPTPNKLSDSMLVDDDDDDNNDLSDGESNKSVSSNKSSEKK
jgi:hypothetical protein